MWDAERRDWGWRRGHFSEGRGRRDGDASALSKVGVEWRISDQGQDAGRGGSAKGRSRYPRPAVGAPSRRGSTIKSRPAWSRHPRRPPPCATPGLDVSSFLRRMRLLLALLALAAARPLARAGERLGFGPVPLG